MAEADLLCKRKRKRIGNEGKRRSQGKLTCCVSEKEKESATKGREEVRGS
jgi:hypothetical protein